MTPRTGNDSRCSNAENAPYLWRYHYQWKHASVDKFRRWFESLSTFAAAHEEGRIAALFELAAQGKLWDSRDSSSVIKPIRSDPEIFELRHTSLNKILRFYHGEPRAYPQYLIALHKHIKSGDKSQQEEIDFAVRLYRPLHDKQLKGCL